MMFVTVSNQLKAQLKQEEEERKAGQRLLEQRLMQEVEDRNVAAKASGSFIDFMKR